MKMSAMAWWIKRLRNLVAWTSWSVVYYVFMLYDKKYETYVDRFCTQVDGSDVVDRYN